MPTATVYRDGKAIRTTVLTDAEAEKFVILAEGVKLAQGVMRNRPEMDSDGRSLKTGSSDTGTPYSERQPDSVYAILPRLSELLGRHARAIYPHLDQRTNGEVLRDPDGSPTYGLMLASKHTPVPEPFHQAASLAGQATALGMLPTDGLAFDYAELTESGPAGVIESGGASVGGSGAPVIRAYVRWRP